ncbi:deoxyribonuclease gamma-like [Gigantopelta aegis]|uniref:deoxyribonuclease gamma-like n=1 Tax=Gigantopelta aegis TaxID=1735272 RepID=UPI001B88E59C|nr:deoxyribonuclease gamma-like [Gigantopelta aegis]
MIAIHASPSQAVKEINALLKVYDVTKKHWGLEDIIIAGDFNADGDYVGNSDWENISLRSDRRFVWLIDDNADTTVGSTDYSYDRFVVAGKKLKKAIVPGSTKVFKFDDEFQLTYEQAQSVSDHYPIELELSGEVNSKLQRYVDSDIAITVKQQSDVASVNRVRQIYRSGARRGYDCLVKKVKTSMLEVVASKYDVTDVVKSLRKFQRAFPQVLLDETIAVVSAYLRSDMFSKPPYIYGLMTKNRSSTFDVTVTCRLQQPLTCCVTVKKKIS